MRRLDVALATILLGGATGAAALFVTLWALLIVPAAIFVVALAVSFAVVFLGGGHG